MSQKSKEVGVPPRCQNMLAYWWVWIECVSKQASRKETRKNYELAKAIRGAIQTEEEEKGMQFWLYRQL